MRLICLIFHRISEQNYGLVISSVNCVNTDSIRSDTIKRSILYSIYIFSIYYYKVDILLVFTTIRYILLLFTTIR